MQVPDGYVSFPVHSQASPSPFVRPEGVRNRRRGRQGAQINILRIHRSVRLLARSRLACQTTTGPYWTRHVLTSANA